MRKLKLLLAACALFAAGQMWAQTDVTATYITNGDFSSTDGWTANQSAQYNALGNGLIGTWAVNSGTVATVDDNHPATAYCFGFQSRWSTNYAYYTQETKELPSGYYRLTFDVQNTNSSTTNTYYEDLCYVMVGTDQYIDADVRQGKAEWMAGNTSWTPHTINFCVNKAQTVTIALGYGQGAVNNLGNAVTPYIYVSNLKLEQLTEAPAILAINKTSFITNPDFANGTSGWTTTTGAQNVGTATNQTGDFHGAFWENWNGSAYTGKLYQTVTGLPAGVYELGLCAFVNNYGDGETQYIYAGSAKTGLTTGTPTRYTVTNVTVTDGTLEIGFEQTVATANWCGIDYATLTKIGDPDLSAFVTAWQNALAAAKAFDQTQKMSTSIKADLNIAISTYDEGMVNTYDQELLQEATVALQNALAKAETSVASYAIIASGTIPDNSLDGWVCENSNTFHINTWSNEGNSDGSQMKTPFIENWVGKGSYLGAGKVYYKLEGLEPGEVYYAQALVRSYNEASSDAPNGPNFFINDVVTSLSEAGTTFTYNGMSGIYATLGGAATIGSDGTLTLGVEIASDRNYNWVAFKNVSIQSMSDAFNAAVAKVTALDGKIPAAAYAAAYAVVKNYSGANYPTTAEGFETAITAIEAAAATASPCVEPYATAKSLIQEAEAMAENYTNLSNPIATAKAGLEALSTASEINDFNTNLAKAVAIFKEWIELKAYADALVAVANDNSEANTTLSGVITEQEANVQAVSEISTEGLATVTTAISTLKAAMVTYVGVANPVGDGAQFDCTFMLTNPDVTDFWDGTWWIAPEGWAKDQTDGNFQVMQNNSVDAADGIHKVFMEYYYLSNNTTYGNGKFNIYTSAILPAGTFSMSCYAFAKEQNYSSGNPKAAVYFYANDTQGSLVDASTLTQQTISFVNDTEQEVKIGLKPLEGNTYNWMGIGYVELYKVPAKTFAISEDVAYDTTQEGAGAVTLTRTINAGNWNTLWLPFSMTEAELKATFGKDVAIAQFSETVNETTPGNSTINFNVMETAAISPNVPVLLKTSTAGTSYTIEGRTIVAGTPTATGTNFDFFGTTAASTTIDAGDYFISADKLYTSTGATTIKGLRAYLKTTEQAPEGARIINFSIDGNETTAIENVAEGTITTGKVYNLQGQEVKSAQKGIFIQNGKKVVIK